MNDYAFGNNTQIRVEQFLLAQTGTYQEQTVRPFKTRYDERIVNQLQEATLGGARLGVSAVNALASDVIQPSANIEGFVGIPEGWQSRRFRFVMRVVEHHPFTPTEKTIRILFGYSDHSDVSHGGLLDPDTRIYFNSETTVRDKLVPGVNGMVRNAMVTAANQIITPTRIMSASGHDTNFQNSNAALHTHMIRPEDVFNLREAKIVSDMAAQNIPGGIDLTYDARTVAGTGQFQFSRRRDTSPSRYVADTLGSLQHAVAEHRMHHTGYLNNNSIGPAVMSEAGANAANVSIGSDAFLAKLRDHAGYMERGYVTLKDFIRLFPEAGDFQNVTKYAVDDGRSTRRITQAGDGEHWRGADKTTIAASLLAQVIPAIMMDNFIRNIHFSVTNSSIPGQFALQIFPNNVRTLIDEVDIVPYLQEFERRLIIDALNSITYRGGIPFHMTVISELSGDTIITISLDNEAPVQYIAPTFTDSLFSPMVSTQHSAAAKVSNDMLAIASDVLNLGAADVNYAVQAAAPTILNPAHSGADNYAADFGLL